MSTRLFVYGTLRQDAASHELMAGAQRVGSARTAPVYTLVTFGWFPGLVVDGTTSVVGELYDVDEATLRALDDYEGEWFARGTVSLSDGAHAVAWFARPEAAAGRAEIPSGDFLQAARGNGSASPDVEST